MENDTFWSEIGSGFGEPGGIPPPRIPRIIPRDSRQQEKPNGEDYWMLAKFYILWLEHKFEVKRRGKKHANKQNRKIKTISSHLTKQACLLHLVWPAQFWKPHYGRLNSPKSEFNWAAIAFSFFLSFLSLRILDIQCYSLIQKQKQNFWATLRTTVSSRC